MFASFHQRGSEVNFGDGSGICDRTNEEWAITQQTPRKAAACSFLE